MVEDCKLVTQIICGQCGEGRVHGVNFWKPISLFADNGKISILSMPSHIFTQTLRSSLTI